MTQLPPNESSVPRLSRVPDLPVYLDEPEPGETSELRLDRVVAALAGVDFEQTWARDENINMRGALRTVYEGAARRLLTAMDDGTLVLDIGADLKAQRDWAYVNRDTHYQRVLQLTDELEELRKELDAAIERGDRLAARLAEAGLTE